MVRAEEEVDRIVVRQDLCKAGKRRGGEQERPEIHMYRQSCMEVGETTYLRKSAESISISPLRVVEPQAACVHDQSVAKRMSFRLKDDDI